MAYDPQNPFSGASPYDAVRQRTAQNYDTSNQQGMEALQRRFAAMGNQNSGAAIKAQQLQDQQNQESKNGALGSINLEEAKTGIGIGEAQKQRDFEKSQQERGIAQQNLALAAQQGQFDKEQIYKNKVADMSNNTELKKIDLESSGQELERQAQAYNTDLSNWQKSHSGGLLGGGGFLGTGIGAGGGGTFFCTECWKRGIATFGEMVRMSKFFLSTIFTRTDVLLYYFKYGPLIVMRANADGFDWEPFKRLCIDEILNLFESGKVKESHDYYKYLIFMMAHNFQVSIPPMRSTLIDRIKAFPQLLTYKYFWRSLQFRFLMVKRDILKASA